MAATDDAPTGDAPTELKEACVRAAHEFIAEHGVERLSLREVARRLGVSHQAPYRHYPSRDHLLAEVLRRCFRHFAQTLDARRHHEDPIADLESLGRQYLAYAAAHPIEYRLMFATPWPQAAQHPELLHEAVHAFDVLRGVLRRLYGTSARAQVDLQAMFVWSTVHGLAGLLQSDAMRDLNMAARTVGRVPRHVLEMLSTALAASLGEAPTARPGTGARRPA